MRYLVPFDFAVAILLASPITAQPGASDAEAVLASIRAFEAARRAHDPEEMRRHVESGGVATCVGCGSDDRVYPSPVTDDIDLIDISLATEEALFDPEVRIYGNLATVWGRYENRASIRRVCGYSSYQLVRIDSRWKILNHSWTIVPDSCASQ